MVSRNSLQPITAFGHRRSSNHGSIHVSGRYRLVCSDTLEISRHYGTHALRAYNHGYGACSSYDSSEHRNACAVAYWLVIDHGMDVVESRMGWRRHEYHGVYATHHHIVQTSRKKNV